MVLRGPVSFLSSVDEKGEKKSRMFDPGLATVVTVLFVSLPLSSKQQGGKEKEKWVPELTKRPLFLWLSESVGRGLLKAWTRLICIP